MSTKKILFQFRDTVKEITLGDKVAITNTNRKSPPQEFTLTKIGRKYATFTMGDGKSSYGDLQFDFSGNENSDYRNNTVYSSLEGYKQVLRNQKALNLFTRLVQDRQQAFTEDQITKAAYALNIFGEYFEGMAK